MRRSVVLLCLVLAGCMTMHKPGETPESKARDRYECEREVYSAINATAPLQQNGMYRDCMRARGYR